MSETKHQTRESNVKGRHEPIFWDIETTGLDPMAQDWWDGEIGAQVTCVVLGRIDGWREAETWEDAEYETKVLWDSDEYQLLKIAQQRLRDFATNIHVEDSDYIPFLVGWNSNGFDHPYIGARYARHGLKNSMVNHRWKRLDLMDALGNDEVMSKAYPGQDDYAKRLGIPVDDSVTGADMVNAFKVDDWDTIAEHGRTDVVEMMKVFVERKQDAMDYLYYLNEDLPEKAPVYSKGANY